MKTYQERLKSLPKWASDWIYRLERDLAYSKHRLDETIAEPEDNATDTYLWNPVDGNRGLPKGSRVVFRPTPDREIMVWVQEGVVHVHAQGIGLANRLVVYPVASNAITLVTGD